MENNIESTLNELVEASKKENLIQFKFEPIHNRRFIVEAKDVFDTFLVKGITQPIFVKKNKWLNKDPKVLKCLGELRITLYSCVAPSTTQQITEATSTGKVFNVTLKQLDVDGNIVGLKVFRNCRVDYFGYTPLNYDDNNVETISVILKCKDVIVEF